VRELARSGEDCQVTPATKALEQAGIAFTVHAYEHDQGHRDAGHGWGREAADQLGLDRDQVFKTLVVVADGKPAVAIVPVSCQLSLKAAGAALGTKRVELCDLAVAERTTGYVAGGISPFGQRKRLPTVIDETCELFDRIYVSGGRRGLDIGVAPADLVSHLAATVAPITG
jgi:Cys-tRNA(Pro)/Cys-tRNA(Cys) deacylase